MYVNSRKLQVTLNMSRGKIHVVSVYVSDISKELKQKEYIYRELQKLIDTIRPRGRISLFFYLNAGEGNVELTDVMQRFNKEATNDIMVKSFYSLTP